MRSDVTNPAIRKFRSTLRSNSRAVVIAISPSPSIRTLCSTAVNRQAQSKAILSELMTAPGSQYTSAMKKALPAQPEAPESKSNEKAQHKTPGTERLCQTQELFAPRANDA